MEGPPALLEAAVKFSHRMDKLVGEAQVLIRSTVAELEAVEATGVDVVVDSNVNTIVEFRASAKELRPFTPPPPLSKKSCNGHCNFGSCHYETLVGDYSYITHSKLSNNLVDEINVQVLNSKSYLQIFLFTVL